MTASPLLDLLAREGRSATASSRREELARVGRKLIAATLEDYSRVRDYERSLAALPPADDDELEAQRFKSIYELYEAWARDAEEVAAGLPALQTVGVEPRDLEALDDALCRVRARLQLTPQQIARARQQVRDGQGVSIAELRRDLQARGRA